MTPKKRLLTALDNKKADRLPVTTHHVMPYFLNKYLNGRSTEDFFNYFGMDPIKWVMKYKNSETGLDYIKNENYNFENFDFHGIESENWRIKVDNLSNNENPRTYRIGFHTPKKILQMVIQYNDYTHWVREHLIKEKTDVDILAEYMTCPVCNVEEVNRIANSYGEKGLIRGHIPGFEFFGQPGCWQDASCLFGIEPLIMETFYDPSWVKIFLQILLERKLKYVQSLKGCRYDLIELGGGDASTTVISPDIFNKFVAPYDSQIIEKAHEHNQKIVYHTCGGMMPILEDIAAMNPDAMETFTPPRMGGDTNLKEAKKRIGSKVCMIGGFDQNNFFNGCSENQTRLEVRRIFNEAGSNGGLILSPSDHFFDANTYLIKVFADEARRCFYS